MKIGIIVLAAGSSSRMNGTPKQALEFKSQSLLRRAAQAATDSNCRPVVVVLGANAETLRAEIEDLPLAIASNQNWAQGISTSIKEGLAKIVEIEPEINAVVISLCDQPFVTAEIFQRLIEAYRATKKAVAASEYENTVGVPALFDRSLFDELMNLQNDTGAKFIIQKYIETVEKILVPEAAFDVDLKADYKRLLRIQDN